MSNNSKNNSLKNKFYFIYHFLNTKYLWFNYLTLLFFIFYSIALCCFLKDLISALNTSGFYGGWTTIDKFTDQSNILLWVYMVFYIFLPKHSFLKNNQWLIANLTYIFFTFIGYNLILVGFAGYRYSGSSYDIFANVWFHIICPISFFVFGFLYFYLNPFQFPNKFWVNMLKMLIYPSIYIIYTITIPFVVNEPNLSDSYSDNHYTVYGNFTNVRDHLSIALPMILLIWLVFFPGSYAIFYYSYKLISKTKKIIK